MCRVFGWGIQETGTIGDKLFQVDVPIIDVKLCENLYKDYNKSVNVEANICAGEKGKDSCKVFDTTLFIVSSNIFTRIYFREILEDH